MIPKYNVILIIIESFIANNVFSVVFNKLHRIDSYEFLNTNFTDC